MGTEVSVWDRTGTISFTDPATTQRSRSVGAAAECWLRLARATQEAACF